MTDANLNEIKEKMTPILKQANIKKAALFGSHVGGDYTDSSDIDLLVEFPEKTTLIDVAHLKHQLEEELNKEVDLVSYRAISPLIKDSILKYQYQVL